MLQRVTGFLVVFLLMFFSSSQGQLYPSPGISISGFKKVHFQPLANPFQSRFGPQLYFHAEDCTPPQKFTLLNLPTGATYVNNLGFFCQQEVKLDKMLAIPIRFRLGSREYVDWMEGKGVSR